MKMPNLDNYLKFYNLFTYLVVTLKYYTSDRKITPKDTYIHTCLKAEENGESATYWDVFDGVMWLCTFIGILIGIGYFRS